MKLVSFTINYLNTKLFVSSVKFCTFLIKKYTFAFGLKNHNFLKLLDHMKIFHQK